MLYPINSNASSSFQRFVVILREICTTLLGIVLSLLEKISSKEPKKGDFGASLDRDNRTLHQIGEIVQKKEVEKDLEQQGERPKGTSSDEKMFNPSGKEEDADKLSESKENLEIPGKKTNAKVDIEKNNKRNQGAEQQVNPNLEVNSGAPQRRFKKSQDRVKKHGEKQEVVDEQPQSDPQKNRQKEAFEGSEKRRKRTKKKKPVRNDGSDGSEGKPLHPSEEPPCKVIESQQIGEDTSVIPTENADPKPSLPLPGKSEGTSSQKSSIEDVSEENKERQHQVTTESVSCPERSRIGRKLVVSQKSCVRRRDQQPDKIVLSEKKEILRKKGKTRKNHLKSPEVAFLSQALTERGIDEIKTLEIETLFLLHSLLLRATAKPAKEISEIFLVEFFHVPDLLEEKKERVLDAIKKHPDYYSEEARGFAKRAFSEEGFRLYMVEAFQSDRCSIEPLTMLNWCFSEGKERTSALFARIEKDEKIAINVAKLLFSGPVHCSLEQYQKLIRSLLDTVDAREVLLEKYQQNRFPNVVIDLCDWESWCEKIPQLRRYFSLSSSETREGQDVFDEWIFKWLISRELPVQDERIHLIERPAHFLVLEATLRKSSCLHEEEKFKSLFKDVSLEEASGSIKFYFEKKMSGLHSFAQHDACFTIFLNALKKPAFFSSILCRKRLEIEVTKEQYVEILSSFDCSEEKRKETENALLDRFSLVGVSKRVQQELFVEAFPFRKEQDLMEYLKKLSLKKDTFKESMDKVQSAIIFYEKTKGVGLSLKNYQWIADKLYPFLIMNSNFVVDDQVAFRLFLTYADYTSRSEKKKEKEASLLEVVIHSNWLSDLHQRGISIQTLLRISTWQPELLHCRSKEEVQEVLQIFLMQLKRFARETNAEKLCQEVNQLQQTWSVPREDRGRWDRLLDAIEKHFLSSYKLHPDHLLLKGDVHKKCDWFEMLPSKSETIDFSILKKIVTHPKTQKRLEMQIDFLEDVLAGNQRYAGMEDKLSSKGGKALDRLRLRLNQFLYGLQKVQEEKTPEEAQYFIRPAVKEFLKVFPYKSSDYNLCYNGLIEALEAQIRSLYWQEDVANSIQENYANELYRTRESIFEAFAKEKFDEDRTFGDGMHVHYVKALRNAFHKRFGLHPLPEEVDLYAKPNTLSISLDADKYMKEHYSPLKLLWLTCRWLQKQQQQEETGVALEWLAELTFSEEQEKVCEEKAVQSFSYHSMEKIVEKSATEQEQIDSFIALCSSHLANDTEQTLSGLLSDEGLKKHPLFDLVVPKHVQQGSDIVLKQHVKRYFLGLLDQAESFTSLLKNKLEGRLVQQKAAKKGWMLSEKKAIELAVHGETKEALQKLYIDQKKQEAKESAKVDVFLVETYSDLLRKSYRNFVQPALCVEASVLAKTMKELSPSTRSKEEVVKAIVQLDQDIVSYFLPKDFAGDEEEKQQYLLSCFLKLNKNSFHIEVANQVRAALAWSQVSKLEKDLSREDVFQLMMMKTEDREMFYVEKFITASSFQSELPDAELLLFQGKPVLSWSSALLVLKKMEVLTKNSL